MKNEMTVEMIEKLVRERAEKERAARNEALKLRLTAPKSFEDMLSELASIGLTERKHAAELPAQTAKPVRALATA